VLKKSEDAIRGHLNEQYDQQRKVNRQLNFPFTGNTHQAELAAKRATDADREDAITALKAAQSKLDAKLGDISDMLKKNSYTDNETLRYEMVTKAKILPKLSRTSA